MTGLLSCAAPVFGKLSFVTRAKINGRYSHGASSMARAER